MQIFILLLVLIDILAVSFEVVVSANIVEFVDPSLGHRIEEALHWTSVSILSIFLIELLILMFVYRRAFFVGPGSFWLKVDLVVVCVDLSACGPIMKTCAKKGIHNVVIVSGGGKELGGDRAAMEAEVKELSLKHKIRVIGPNCIGMFNAANRLDCAFQGQARMVRSKLGNVAFCLLYTSPSPRDGLLSRMPSSA